jgi:hypothetical protein
MTYSDIKIKTLTVVAKVFKGGFGFVYKYIISKKEKWMTLTKLAIVL